jgi:protein involved in polysaccharide export with SLBB domain
MNAYPRHRMPAVSAVAGQISLFAWLPLLFTLAVLTATAIVSPARAGDSDDYVVGRQDKLKLKVYEWRASRDEIFEWAAFNGEVIVGPSGKIALPLIGEIRAAGSTTSDLASHIGATLKARIGLVEQPDVSIEVIQFRPFYIIGQVDKPGEYPYRPGMTVLQAFSVSGGLSRGADVAGARLEREIISSKGELELLANEHSALLARKARLEAELKRANAVDFPQVLLDRQHQDPFVRQAIDQERLIFEARKEGLDTQLTALKQLKAFLEKEATSLAGQVGTHNTQMKLLREELTSVVTLADKGLATAPRRLALERNVAQLEGDGMRLDSTLLRARQEISKTEIAILELDNRRVSEVTVELQAAQLNLERITQKMETSERLLYESEVIAPRYLLDRTKSTRSQPRFTISRAVEGRVEEIAATETTEVRPGDTIKVEMPVSGEIGSAFAPPSDASSKLTFPSPQRLSQDRLRRSSN